MAAISKNKKYQYFFFFIITFYSIFNGGNSNLLIQINFLLISLFFIFCLKDKNYNLHFRYFFNQNKFSICLYLLFLAYLLFQILPLPIDSLKFFSPEKFYFLNLLNNEISFSSVSLAPSNTFFQFLNFCSLLIVVFILKMIFYRERHKQRFYLFLSIIGFLSACFGTLLYLTGSTDLLSFKSFNSGVSTGFFVSRTVFSIFLLFCFISSLEYLKRSQISERNFFSRAYVRLFIIFITIGIITSFSRIGNFLLLNVVLFYLLNEFFLKKQNSNLFRNIILIIVFVDIVVLGLYFGSFRIVERFLFLKNEFSEITNPDVNLMRFQIIKFSLHQIYKYLIFGYGAGGFETMFQLSFPNLSNSFANHAHSDLIEFVGEVGLLGFALFFLSISSFLKEFIKFNFKNLLLIFCMCIVLLFDFSLHIPFIQFLFVCFFALNQKLTKLS
jgi:O-antigen ligase